MSDAMPCEPCGECGWCQRRVDLNVAIKTLRAQNGRLRRALRAAVNAIKDELDAAGTDDVAEHPVLRSHQRTATACEKALRETA